ncbi:MAG: PAS domain-containing sensor histidine kinase [Pseudomonadota bacterium]
MASFAIAERPKVKLAAASAVFRVVFAIAVVVAAGTTYIAVTGSINPLAAGRSQLIWLLWANLVLIIGLGAALGVRVWRLWRENSATGGGARLRLRIIALFCVGAMAPTLAVAGLLGATISRGIESWFSERVYAVMDNAAQAAQASLDEVTTDVEAKLREMAADLNEPGAVRGFTDDPELYATYLRDQSLLRELPTVFILNRNGDALFETRAPDAPEFATLSESNWAAAANGLIAMAVDKDLVVRALYRLSGYSDAYLYVARQGPQTVAAQLRATQAGLSAYREADDRRTSLRVIFALSYLETALLVLLGTAWLGMAAAAQITSPLGELAAAARAVRDGDLSVRLERPTDRDEIDDLTDAFNQMTSRLSRQTHALDTARIDAENRSAFIEAVLSGVEAGVMRIDPAFNITVANQSAGRLLGASARSLNSADLTEAAPEFAAAARKALEGGQVVDASLKRDGAKGASNLHLRAAPAADGSGVVLTFHDTSRLIAGQRQAAWRDVARRIAHEIRNPLTPIQLSAERLRRRFGDQIETDRDTFDRCTATILRQVEDIGRMVEEFSNFARMPKPTVERFDVGEMTNAVVFAQKMASPSMSVTSHIPNEPLVLLGDERLLSQALANVVKNAAESVDRAMNAGGSKTGAVSVEVLHQDDEALLVVRDTGVGFPEADRERVLEPYVTTRESGVGLGLAIVNRIVEDHGGRVELGDNENAPNGARVELRLPITPRHLAEEPHGAGVGVG